MLRDAASNGVFVSTHPDVILKMGTKEVLFQTREIDWGGGDIYLYKSMNQCESYLAGSGQMIDQPFHSPQPDGMVRCYMTHNVVVGFGHQYVIALLRSPSGSEPLQAQPRTYHPETKSEFQAFKTKMESEWIPQLQKLLNIETESLPIIWDADFHYGPKTAAGEDTYVLCEINVSSVHPFPDSALPRFVKIAVASVKNYQN